MSGLLPSLRLGGGAPAWLLLKGASARMMSAGAAQPTSENATKPGPWCVSIERQPPPPPPTPADSFAASPAYFLALPSPRDGSVILHSGCVCVNILFLVILDAGHPLPTRCRCRLREERAEGGGRGDVGAVELKERVGMCTGRLGTMGTITFRRRERCVF